MLVGHENLTPIYFTYSCYGMLVWVKLTHANIMCQSFGLPSLKAILISSLSAHRSSTIYEQKVMGQSSHILTTWLHKG